MKDIHQQWDRRITLRRVKMKESQVQKVLSSVWRETQTGTNIQTHSEKPQTAAMSLPVVFYYWVQSDRQESSGGHEDRVQPGLRDYMRLSSPPLTELLWFLHSFSQVNPLFHLVFLVLERDGEWQDVTAAHTRNKREEKQKRLNAFYAKYKYSQHRGLFLCY